MLLKSFAALLLGAFPHPTPGNANQEVRYTPQHVVASGELRLPSPFALIADGGARDIATVSFDPTDYTRLAAVNATQRVVRLSDFALPGERGLELVLRPRPLMEAGGYAVAVGADGKERRVTPTVVAFAGHVEGRASNVYLALSPTMLHGYVTLDGELYSLTTGGAAPGTATIAHGSQLGELAGNAWCQALEEQGLIPPDNPAGSQQLGTPLLRFADIFVEADDQYRALFASDQDCVDYTLLLFGASSEIFRRDLGFVHMIPSGYLRIWNTTPPWGVITTFNDVFKVRTYWRDDSNPNKYLPRASVHVLTTPVFGGVAIQVGGLCSKTRAYGISSVFGTFPFPVQHTSGSNWDLMVVSHELGHTWGSGHTFDYKPPIDCEDGSGPDKGTIMSYCHLNAGGVNNMGMRFHARVQTQIGWATGSAFCVVDQPLALGDYDNDGLLTPADLAAFDTCFNQGFRSMACEDVFDMNQDGVFDTTDRDLLENALLPAASVTLRNGSNLGCYTEVGGQTPVLGQTWSGLVSTSGSSVLTQILIHDQPALTSTTFGDFLVGGTRLLASSATSVAGVAQHDFALPNDPSLAGITAYTQGVAFESSGLVLCNALDLFVSVY